MTSEAHSNLVAVATLLLAAVDSPGMQSRIAPEKENKMLFNEHRNQHQTASEKNKTCLSEE
jgi:hypothetical protein